MKRNDKGQFTSDISLSKELNRIVDTYIESLSEQKDSKPKTLDTRRTEVKYWLSFIDNRGIDPFEAKEEHVRAYIQDKSGLAGTTLSSYYASVSSFYSILNNDQLHESFANINHHPCENINLAQDYSIYNQSEYQKEQKLNNDKDSIITIPKEDIERIISSVEGEQQTRQMHSCIIRLIYYTGCRADEISRMKVKNIDWDNCAINIRSSKLNAKQHEDLIRRDVIFPESFKYELKRWAEHVRPSYSSYASKSEYLFLSHQSPQLNPSSITDIVKDSAHRANEKYNEQIQKPLRPANPEPSETVQEWLVTPHRLRRTAISHWVNNCDDIAIHQARRLAGHAQIEQTLEYVEEDKEQLRKDYQSSY
jgi:integrase/recombinase XerD